MKFDVFGTRTSLSNERALLAWNDTMLGFLAHAAVTPEHLGKVLETEPDFAHAHALKGLFYVLLDRRELLQTAKDAYATARGVLAQSDATARERKYVDALGAWLDGSPSGTVALFEDILHSHPQDALAMKLGHAVRFILGDAKGMRRVGGSHAQRDVFERMTIDAGIRAGYLDQAEAILDDRQSKRAGREDGYAANRRALIASGRIAYDATSVPAE